MQEKGGPSPIPPKVSDFEKVTKNICNITFQIQGAGWVQPNLENLKNLWNLLVVHNIFDTWKAHLFSQDSSENVAVTAIPDSKCDHPISPNLKMWPPSFSQAENVTTQFHPTWKCDHSVSLKLKMWPPDFPQPKRPDTNSMTRVVVKKPSWQKA